MGLSGLGADQKRDVLAKVRGILEGIKSLGFCEVWLNSMVLFTRLKTVQTLFKL